MINGGGWGGRGGGGGGGGRGVGGGGGGERSSMWWGPFLLGAPMHVPILPCPKSGPEFNTS